MYCHALLWNRQTYPGAWQTINTTHCHALPCMTAPCIFSSHVLPCIVEQGFFLENDKDMRCHVLQCANKCNTWEYMVPNQLFVLSNQALPCAAMYVLPCARKYNHALPCASHVFPCAKTWRCSLHIFLKDSYPTKLILLQRPTGINLNLTEKTLIENWWEEGKFINRTCLQLLTLFEIGAEARHWIAASERTSAAADAFYLMIKIVTFVWCKFYFCLASKTPRVYIEISKNQALLGCER